SQGRDGWLYSDLRVGGAELVRKLRRLWRARRPGSGQRAGRGRLRADGGVHGWRRDVPRDRAALEREPADRAVGDARPLVVGDDATCDLAVWAVALTFPNAAVRAGEHLGRDVRELAGLPVELLAE